MTFNIQFFAAAVGHSLWIGRAWAQIRRAERSRLEQHHDPIPQSHRGHYLGMLTRMN